MFVIVVPLEYNKYMKDRSIIGARIERAREFRKMDRNQLADAVGCSYREILRWETTNQEPKAMTLKKIADALGVKVDYFVEEEIKNPQILYYLQDRFETEGRLQEEAELKEKKNTAISHLAEIQDLYTLKIACHLMINYIDSESLKSLYSIIKTISGFGYDTGQNLKPEDEFYRQLTYIIDRTKDSDLLRKIAEITINSTKTDLIPKQIEITKVFSAHPVPEPDLLENN